MSAEPEDYARCLAQQVEPSLDDPAAVAAFAATVLELAALELSPHPGAVFSSDALFWTAYWFAGPAFAVRIAPEVLREAVARADFLEPVPGGLRLR